MCQIRVLSSKKQAVISHCIHCKMVLVWHQNLLLNFTPEEFLSFRNMIFKLDYYDCCVEFNDGEERAIIRTPNHDICFAFNYEEWENLRDAIEEAVYMNEVYQLMQSG